MYEQLNRLAASVVKHATHRMKGWSHLKDRPVSNVKLAGVGHAATLAAEVASLLPVKSRQDFEVLDAQLINVRMFMRMGPPLGAPLREALDRLGRECVVVRAALENE